MAAPSDLMAIALSRRQEAAPLPADAVFEQAGDAPVDAALFREAIARIGASVHLVTATWNGRRYGITVTAACSLSADPPSVLVSINRQASIYPAILRSGALCVNVLAPDHRALAERFGRAGMAGDARFAEGAWHESPGGSPRLADAAASIDCVIEATMSMGTHTVFGCRVRHVALGRDARSLIYARRDYLAS